MVKVKICGLTRREDVDLAIELGADALGFILEPASLRYVGSRASELVNAVGPYVMCVGVFGQFNSLDCENVNAVQFSEFGGTTSILSSVGFARTPAVIKTVRVNVGEHAGLALKLIDDWLAQFQIEPRGILLDAYDPNHYGGTGKTIDWAYAAEFVQLSPRPVILAGGLTPDNVATAIAKVHPYAVDVSSGVESSPGIKDPHKLRDFIQAAKS